MKKILLLFAICFALAACDDNDSPTRELSFKIPEIFEVGDECFIFLSDDHGKLIDFADVVEGTTVRLRVPGNVTSRITVNFFSGRVYPSGIRRELRAFVDVEPGEYMIPGLTGQVSTPDNFTLDLKNMPASSVFLLTGTGYDFRFNAGADTTVSGMTSLFSNGHRTALACIMDAGDKSRFQFMDVTKNSKLTFDYNDALPLDAFNLEFETEDYAFEQTVYKDGMRFPLQWHDQMSIKPSPSIKPRLYHSSSFDLQNTSLRVRINNVTYGNDYWGKEIPDHFDMLEATASLSNENDDAFTITTTGTADILQTGYNHNKTIEGLYLEEYRTVFIPFGNVITYRHPEIPEQIMSKFYPHGQDIRHLDGALLTDYETALYQDYIKLRLEIPTYFGAPPKKIQDNMRSKSFAF